MGFGETVLAVMVGVSALNMLTFLILIVGSIFTRKS